MEKDGKKMKKRLVRIVIAAVLFTAALLVGEAVPWLRIGIFIASYLVIGYDVVLNAVRNIAHGRVFDENFLMSLATIGAFATGEYPEAVAVMLFYQIGELFQSYAVGKSRKSISALMDIRPDYANILRADGQTEKVEPDEVKVGDTIVIKSGERIPLDAVVTEGESMIDTTALTGESVPRSAKPGDSILSGCINLSGVLRAETTKEYGESTVSKVLDLVENASGRKSRSETFITRFAAVYTPIVVIAAVLLAFVPPIFSGYTWENFSFWVTRALSFLVVSCPCALVISVPLSFFGGIGGASKAGILVKGSNYLEALAKTDTVVFDKTGTLTKGVFEVTESKAFGGYTEEQLAEYTAFAECYSGHPISVSLRKAWNKEIDEKLVTDVTEVSGHGIRAKVRGKEVLVGNAGLLKSENIEFSPVDIRGTIVYTAVDGKYAGYTVISDVVKADSAEAIAELKKIGINRTVMLTGDAKAVGESVAAELGLDSVYTELLPGDKVDKLEELFKTQNSRNTLAFVGDGINDAPVLARADVGIAMGGLGSDAAIDAADIVIMNDAPSKLPEAIGIARHTLLIAKENIVFAIAVKVLTLVLIAFGFVNMWMAVFADVGVCVIAVINAMRALKTKKKPSAESIRLSEAK